MASNNESVGVATWRDFPQPDDKSKTEAKSAPAKKEN